MDISKVNDLLGRIDDVYGDSSKKKFNEGDRIRITGSVIDSGQLGIVNKISGNFVTVKMDDGCVRNYHQTDISPFRAEIEK